MVLVRTDHSHSVRACWRDHKRIEKKKLLEDAVDFDQARALEQVVVVVSKTKTTAQRTPRDVPRALPEARAVPEPTPTGSASQLAARGAESADDPACAAASERKWDGTLREIIGEESTREEASLSLLDGLLVLGMGGPHRADARRMPTELAVNSNARMCRETSMLSPVSHHGFTSDMSAPHHQFFTTLSESQLFSCCSWSMSFLPPVKIVKTWYTERKYMTLYFRIRAIAQKTSDVIVQFSEGSVRGRPWLGDNTSKRSLFPECFWCAQTTHVVCAHAGA